MIQNHLLPACLNNPIRFLKLNDPTVREIKIHLTYGFVYNVCKTQVKWARLANLASEGVESFSSERNLNAQ